MARAHPTAWRAPPGAQRSCRRRGRRRGAPRWRSCARAPHRSPAPAPQKHYCQAAFSPVPSLPSRRVWAFCVGVGMELMGSVLKSCSVPRNGGFCFPSVNAASAFHVATGSG